MGFTTFQVAALDGTTQYCLGMLGKLFAINLRICEVDAVLSRKWMEWDLDNGRLAGIRREKWENIGEEDSLRMTGNRRRN